MVGGNNVLNSNCPKESGICFMLPANILAMQEINGHHNYVRTGRVACGVIRIEELDLQASQCSRWDPSENASDECQYTRCKSRNKSSMGNLENNLRTIYP